MAVKNLNFYLNLVSGKFKYAIKFFQIRQRKYACYAKFYVNYKKINQRVVIVKTSSMLKALNNRTQVGELRYVGKFKDEFVWVKAFKNKFTFYTYYDPLEKSVIESIVSPIEWEFPDNSTISDIIKIFQINDIQTKYDIFDFH